MRGEVILESHREIAKRLHASPLVAKHAIDALVSLSQRLEASLESNAAAVSALDVTVRKGLDAALGRIAAEQHVDASIGKIRTGPD